MTRMLGVCQRSWCPACHSPSGPDCPDVSRSKGQARAEERRRWRREADLGDEFAVFAAESLEWAEATMAAGLPSWEYQEQ